MMYSVSMDSNFGLHSLIHPLKWFFPSPQENDLT